jgi:hypothetical protein
MVLGTRKNKKQGKPQTKKYQKGGLFTYENIRNSDTVRRASEIAKSAKDVIRNSTINMGLTSAFKKTDPEFNPKSQEEAIKILNNAYEKQDFCNTLLIILPELYNQYVVCKLDESIVDEPKDITEETSIASKFTKTAQNLVDRLNESIHTSGSENATVSKNKMPVFRDELVIFKEKIGKIKNNFILLFNKAIGGEIEIVEVKEQNTEELTKDSQDSTEDSEKSIVDLPTVNLTGVDIGSSLENVANELESQENSPEVAQNNNVVPNIKSYNRGNQTYEFIQEKDKNNTDWLSSLSDKYIYRCSKIPFTISYDSKETSENPLRKYIKTGGISTNPYYSGLIVGENKNYAAGVIEFYYSPTERTLFDKDKKRISYNNSTILDAGDYVTERNIFGVNIFMKTIIENEWLKYTYKDGDTPKTFYFNTILCVFGLPYCREKIIGEGNEALLDEKTRWIIYRDTFGDEIRCFCPGLRLYGKLNLSDLSDLSDSNNRNLEEIVASNNTTSIEFFDPNYDAVFILTNDGEYKPKPGKMFGSNLTYNVNKGREFMNEKLNESFEKIAGIPHSVLRIGLKSKNAIAATLSGYKYNVKEDCNEISSFRGLKDTIKTMNDENKNIDIMNIARYKIVIKEIGQRERNDLANGIILHKLQYFARVMIFLHIFEKALLNQIQKFHDNTSITEDMKENMRRIQDLGFFILRKTHISGELKHLFKEVGSIAGNFFTSPLKLSGYLVGKAITKTSTLFMSDEDKKIKQITEGVVIKGGGPDDTSESNAEVPHQSSYISYNFLSGLIRSIDCDIRDKYEFLSYVNNFLYTFQSNIFSNETLQQGKSTFKDKVTRFVMEPYRFFKGNKILGPIFLAFAVIGGGITAASLATPISPAIIEGLAIGGKILKIGCLPFLYPSDQFARTKEDMLKIQHELCVSVKNDQFRQKMENANKTLSTIFGKTIVIDIYPSVNISDNQPVKVTDQQGGKTRRRRRNKNKRRFTRKHK